MTARTSSRIQPCARLVRRWATVKAPTDTPSGQERSTTDPAHAMERRVSVVLLGTKGGPAVRRGGAMPTSSLLRFGGVDIVVDAGLGVTRALVDAGADLRSIDAVFVTHLHSDHVLELGPLVHTAWTTGRTRTLTIVGPPGIDALWTSFLASMRLDVEVRIADEGRPPLDRLVRLVTLTEGPVPWCPDDCEEADVSVEALRVPHPPIDACFALRFRGLGRSVTFSADTAPFPPLADFAKGSDVLVHEAMLEEAVDALVVRTGLGDDLRRHLMASHSPADEAGRIATDAGVRHLVLHHLIPADDDAFDEADWIAATRTTWAGRLTIGRDGMEVVVHQEGFEPSTDRLEGGCSIH